MHVSLIRCFTPEKDKKTLGVLENFMVPYLLNFRNSANFTLHQAGVLRKGKFVPVYAMKSCR
jgi:hypothetical protein